MEPGNVRGQPANLQEIGEGGTTDDTATLNYSFLEFLTDELVFGSETLDPATLEAVFQVASSQKQAAGAAMKADAFAAAQSGSLGGMTSAPKRALEENALSDSDDEEEGGKGDKSSGKKAKGEMSAAATKKACREKARREKLNERFLDLARLVDPNSEPKTDKSTILTDAIKYVQQITVENHQLRQLNKFLEERVSALERERGQQLYQQSLIMTAMGQGHMMPTGQAMLMGPPPGMLAGSGLAGAAMPHPQMAMPSAAMASSSNVLLSAASLPAAPTPPLPAMPTQQQHAASGGLMAQGGMLAHSASGLLAQATGGIMAQGPGAMMPQAPGGLLGQVPIAGGPQPAASSLAAGAAGAVMPFTAGAGPSKPVMVNAVPGPVPYPAMYWLPPQMMDSTQDSLLRPPAA